VVKKWKISFSLLEVVVSLFPALGAHLSGKRDVDADLLQVFKKIPYNMEK